MSDDEEGPAESEEEGDHPPCGEEAGDSPVQTLCVPRGRHQRVRASGTGWESLRDWPRFVSVEIRGGRGHPKLFLPNSEGVWNLVPLTVARIASYMGATRPPYQKRSQGSWVEGDDNLDTRPKKSSPYTWGPFVTCRVPVSTLEEVEGQRVVRWYPPSDPRAQWWTFRIYNITVEAPDQEVYWPNRAWLPYLQRTVMRIPVQHLRATRFRGVYLGFTVGSPLQPRQLPKSGVVSSGGANNLLNRPILSRFGDESGVLTTVDITYAALNRPWAEFSLAEVRQRAANGPTPDTTPLLAPDAPEEELAGAFDRDPPGPSDQPGAGLEEWFRAPLSIQDTLLHEFGHLLDKVRPALIDYPTEYGGASADWEQERSDTSRAFQSLRTGTRAAKGPTWETFNQYMREIHYGGSTQDATEGFAEAYKRHFSGLNLAQRPGGTPGSRAGAVLELLLQNGFPSLTSVRRAALAQARYMANEPDLLIPNPSPDPWNPHNDHERQRRATAG